MPTSVQPPYPQWPLRPDARIPRRDLSEEFLALERVPAKGKLSGLSVAIAEWLSVDVLVVRALFVITALSSGLGLMLYLAGVLLTADVRTGAAPLDRVGTNWHSFPGRVVVGWALGLSALMALTFGSELGTNWGSVGVLAVTGWLGWRMSSRTRPSGRSRHLGSASVRQPLPPDARSAARPTRNTVPLAILTLCLAALAFGVTLQERPDDLSLALAVALAVIGVGLGVIAWRGRSLLLVFSGLLMAAALGASVFLRPMAMTEPRMIVDQAELYDLLITDSSYSADLSAVQPTTDIDWTLKLDSSTATLVLPDGPNVDVTVNYLGSWVALPGDQFDAGTGVATYRRLDQPDEPTLTIIIEADSSAVWVVP